MTRPTAGAASALAAPEPAAKFRITDNSFLVEAAFNQDAGVFQNSFVMARSGAVGDGLINYRFQAWSGKGKLPLFSPRLSAVLPTSAQRREYGTGTLWQTTPSAA